MSYVTFAEFQVRYGRDIPAADEEQIGAFLEDACGMMGDVLGIEYDEDPSGNVAPAGVVSVICTAVRRAYENPDGLSMEVTGGHTWMTSPSGSGVYFTAAELRIARRAAKKLGMVSATLTSWIPAVNDEQYVAVNGGEPVLYMAEDEIVP